jgi:hypothetical protein
MQINLSYFYLAGKSTTKLLYRVSNFILPSTYTYAQYAKLLHLGIFLVKTGPCFTN